MGPWVVCTEEGALVQLNPVAAEDYAVLAAVEAAMARSTLTAPVSGGSHSAFRSAVGGSAGGSRALSRSLSGASQPYKCLAPGKCLFYLFCSNSW